MLSLLLNKKSKKYTRGSSRAPRRQAILEPGSHCLREPNQKCPPILWGGSQVWLASCRS